MTEVGALRTRLTMLDQGTTRGLQGFRDTLKGIRSEMNVARSAGQAYGRSIDGLRQKSDILSRRLEVQQRQVMALRSRYDQARLAKNRNEKAVMDLSRQYNNAVAAMNRTKSSLEGVNNELSRAQNPWLNMGNNLTTVGDKLQTVGRDMSAFGRSYTMRVTAPIIAGGISMIKAASDYESAFAGVRKTVDATESEYARLSRGIRDMALEIPAAATEIARVGEAAGQLGIEKEHILSFTRTMIDLGVATDMSSDDAAMALARLANITGMAQTDFDRLGATIVDLGNNFAATEGEISEMALRIAGAGTQINMSEADILGFAAALTSVGIKAEAGGTAISKLMIEMASDVDQGGKRLKEFARIAGMSTSDFRKAFEEDAATAIFTFLGGLGDLSEQGESAFQIIDELGLSEIRLRDTILRSSSARDMANDALKTANQAWEENIALTNEAEERYATTESQLQMLKNRFFDIGITMGEALIPAMFAALEAAEPLIKSIEDGARAFADMDTQQQQTILKFVALAAAVGPASIVLGGLTTTLGGIVKVIGTVATAFGNVGGKGLLGRIGMLGLGAAGPVGLAIAGVGALGLAIWDWKKTADEASESNLELVQSLNDQHTELEASVAKYEELRGKAEITTGQIKELLEIRHEMAKNPEVEALEELEKRYDALVEKTGLTHEEIEELLDANASIIDQAPQVAEAHTVHGEAVAGVGEELQKLVDNTLEVAKAEAELQRGNWAEERVEHIRNAAQAEKEREETLERISLLTELQNEDQMVLNDRLNEAKDISGNYLYTQEQQNEARREADVLEAILNGKAGELRDTLKEQLDEQNNIIAAAEEHRIKGELLDAEYLQILLKSIGINEEGQKGVDVANEQLNKLREQKAELESKIKREGDQTGTLKDQLGVINEQIGAYETTLGLIDREIGSVQTVTGEEKKRERQIAFNNDILAQASGIHDNNTAAQGRTNSKIDEGTGKAEDMNRTLGQDIDKSVDVDDNGTAKAISDEASKSATKRVTLSAVWKNVASGLSAGIRSVLGNIPGFAEGTNSAPGGPAWVGEEGYELARHGNKWAMLDFGITNLPRGTQVFTHDETKKILSSLNKIPAYASGVSPSGEADRIVQRLNGQSNMSDGTVRVIVNPAPVVINGEKVAEVTFPEIDVRQGRVSRRNALSGGVRI